MESIEDISIVCHFRCNERQCNQLNELIVNNGHNYHKTDPKLNDSSSGQLNESIVNIDHNYYKTDPKQSCGQLSVEMVRSDDNMTVIGGNGSGMADQLMEINENKDSYGLRKRRQRIETMDYSEVVIEDKKYYLCETIGCSKTSSTLSGIQNHIRSKHYIYSALRSINGFNSRDITTKKSEKRKRIKKNNLIDPKVTVPQSEDNSNSIDQTISEPNDENSQQLSDYSLNVNNISEKTVLIEVKTVEQNLNSVSNETIGRNENIIETQMADNYRSNGEQMEPLNGLYVKSNPNIDCFDSNIQFIDPKELEIYLNQMDSKESVKSETIENNGCNEVMRKYVNVYHCFIIDNNSIEAEEITDEDINKWMENQTKNKKLKYNCNRFDCNQTYGSFEEVLRHKKNHLCGYGIEGVEDKECSTFSIEDSHSFVFSKSGKYLIYECELNCDFVTKDWAQLRDHIHDQHIHPINDYHKWLFANQLAEKTFEILNI